VFPGTPIVIAHGYSGTAICKRESIFVVVIPSAFITKII
jgi:hypothetical protein